MAAARRGQQGSHCPRLGALATEVIPNAGMFAATPEAAHTYWRSQGRGRGSWPGSAHPRAAAAATRQRCSEERQERVHLRTETWPRGERQGKHPCSLLGPPRASLSLPK